MSDDDSLTLARQIAAQAWCADANAHKIMDVDLCDAFAHLMAAELDRLRAECLRLSHAEAEAMSVVLSQEGQIDRLRAELARVTGECERLRGAVDALLEIAEQSVDTRRCSAGILRAMNDARAALAKAPPA